MLSVVSTWPDWLRVWRPSIATAMRDNSTAVSWCLRCCATFSITSFVFFCLSDTVSLVLVLDSLIWFQKPANFTFSGECSASDPWKWRHPSKMVMSHVREKMDLIHGRHDRGGGRRRFQWCAWRLAPDDSQGSDWRHCLTDSFSAFVWLSVSFVWRCDRLMRDWLQRCLQNFRD